MGKKIYRIARNFTSQAAQDNISAYAASTAFFSFLSMIPMLLLLCTILPYTPITESLLMKVAVELTPKRMDGLAITLIEEVYNKSTGAMSAAAIITIWTAAKGMLALMRGLNAVNGVVEKRNYFVLRLTASIYTVFMILLIVGSLVILVFGNVIIELAFRDFPQMKMVMKGVMHFRFLPVWLIMTVLFALLYTYVPQIETKFRYQIPGALFAAVAWSIFSWGFSVYVDCFQGFGMYGNLTTVIMIMLWLYFCMYLLMIGANMNKYFHPAITFFYHKRHEEKDDENK